MSSEPTGAAICEPHHWVSIHQPDFPPGLYWISRCSLCGTINSAELTNFTSGCRLRDRISEALHLDIDGEPVRDPDARQVSGDIRTFLRGWDAGVAEMQDRARAVLAVPDEVAGFMEALAGTGTPAGSGSDDDGDPGAHWCEAADDLAAQLEAAQALMRTAIVSRHRVEIREAALAGAARNLLATLEASASTSRLREAIKASTERDRPVSSEEADPRRAVPRSTRTACTWCDRKATKRLFIGFTGLSWGCDEHAARWLDGEEM